MPLSQLLFFKCFNSKPAITYLGVRCPEPLRHSYGKCVSCLSHRCDKIPNKLREERLIWEYSSRDRVHHGVSVWGVQFTAVAVGDDCSHLSRTGSRKGGAMFLEF